MARIAKRKVPPSRVRYEQSHPTVSCRVSKEMYDRLTLAKQAEGKSFAAILKLGLGIIEEGVKKQVEVRKKGWNEGYKKGYADAMNRYKVTYHCAKCGQLMEVQHPNEKQAIDEYMKEKGWFHSECPQLVR